MIVFVDGWQVGRAFLTNCGTSCEVEIAFVGLDWLAEKWDFEVIFELDSLMVDEVLVEVDKVEEVCVEFKMVNYVF